jgi:hypothetical protein
MVAGYNMDFHYRAEADIAKANISEDAYSSSLMVMSCTITRDENIP